MVLVPAGSGVGRGAGGGDVPTACTAGWHLIAEEDDSFLWQGLLESASWTGSVRLLENKNTDCYVLNIRVDFTGPLGGTLSLRGNPFVSFTVQSPDPFRNSGDVARNAFGDLGYFSPEAGDYVTYTVQPHLDINARGADEYYVRSLGVGVVAAVEVSFDLPLELLGQTVYAQIHVGPDHCQCVATPFDVPGSAPPPPPPADTTPPATTTDLAAQSVGTSYVVLGWTAPGDDGAAGQAAQYEFRYSVSGALTAANFAQGTPVATPAPAPAGAAERLNVTGLLEGTQYWFALRTADEVPNWSPVSNSPDATTGTPPPPARSWSVYIHAHPDDWQLFMGPIPVYDYQSGRSLLFVYATAGDAGVDSYWWTAREQGAEASVREAVGAGAPEGSGWAHVCYRDPSPVCHDIWQWSYGSSISFFMRLPDGNYGGSGFPRTGNVSLAKLRDGAIPSVSAVDGSATYQGWSDFYLTVRAIVVGYTPYDATTRVVSPDGDRTRQGTQDGGCPGCPDHADHAAVGDAVDTISTGMGAPWTRTVVIDYPIMYQDSRYPVNLDSAAYDIKKRLFMAYSDKVKALTGLDEYESGKDVWEPAFWRYYERTP